MTAPQENHSSAGSAASGDAHKAGRATRTVLSAALVGVLLVVGVVVSVIIIVRGDDGALVAPPAASHDDRHQGRNEALFEQDPRLDNLNRPVYVPLDERGVLLTQQPAPANRSDTDAPGGVMLQLVHHKMVLPFTTTDGPTGFTANGIATGFARTPQGAGIAGAHYLAYLTTSPGLIELMQEAGLAEDQQGLLEQQARDLAALGEDAPSSPGVLPYLKVDYHNGDLARVYFGAPLTAPNGETGNYMGWLDLAWRDDQGWTVLVRGKETFGSDWVNSLAGWSQWW